MSGPDIAAKVSEVATTLEIEHLLDRRPRQLSGGQRQRVALARAIVRDPAAFLMDEPLSNLDARLRLSMRGELKRLCQRLGATTLYVTHDQAEALTMADLIAVMNAGELQQVGSPGGDLRTAREPLRRHLRRQSSDERGQSPPDGRRIAGWRRRCRAQGGKARGLRRGRSDRDRRAPEDFSLVDLATPGALKGEVYVVEPMGNETLVEVRVGAEHLSVRAGRGFTARVGSKVGVKFDADDACFFDARASPSFTASIEEGATMSSTDSGKGGVDRRSLLKGGAGAALLAGLGAATPAKAAGKKVVIGGFVDGALVPFKDKIIPLAQQQGFDIQFLQDEYGVTLEKFFNDAQSGAGQYDLYLLDDPWVPQFGAAEVLEDLGAAGSTAPTRIGSSR